MDTTEMVDATLKLEEDSLSRRLTSRKFITMNILQTMWIGLFLLGKLSESGLIELTTVTVGAYFIANAATHFAKK
jgi:hypothetical protein